MPKAQRKLLFKKRQPRISSEPPKIQSVIKPTLCLEMHLDYPLFFFEEPLADVRFALNKPNEAFDVP